MMPSGHFAQYLRYMTTCKYIALVNILAAQLITSYGLPSRYHLYSNKYYTPANHIHGYRTGHQYHKLNNDFYFPNVPRTKQNKHHNRVMAFGGRVAPNENAERKITFYENLNPKQINSSKPPPIKKPLIFKNFVTPKLELLPKKNSYDVTTKATQEFVTTARPPRLTDNDAPIAFDDEDSVTSGVYAVKGRRRPEHLNPLLYVDSYGNVHKRPATDDVAESSVRDYGLEKPSRVVIHDSPGYSHGRDYEQGHEYGVLPHPSHHYKKHTGRVRIQVFRGPTRKYGRKRYAPWGYYVVQPADNSYHNQHQYP